MQMYKSINKYNKIKDKRDARLTNQQNNNKLAIKPVIDKCNRKTEKINSLSLGLISGYCKYAYDIELLTGQYIYYRSCDLCDTTMLVSLPIH